jgi:hypothetical protein
MFVISKKQTISYGMDLKIFRNTHSLAFGFLFFVISISAAFGTGSALYTKKPEFSLIICVKRTRRKKGHSNTYIFKNIEGIK